MKKEKSQFIFQCYKCGHFVFVAKEKIMKILKTDCPECGEEPFKNWFFIDEGDYKTDAKHL